MMGQSMWSQGPAVVVDRKSLYIRGCGGMVSALITDHCDISVLCSAFCLQEVLGPRFVTRGADSRD
jgi:hypothetical protein